MACFLALPFCISILQDYETQVEPWIQVVKWTLLQESFFGGSSVSKNLREELLSEQDADDDDCFDLEEIDDHDEDDSWKILQGVPRRPLYKELAYRLCRWSKRGCTGDQLFIPAETLNMKEEAVLAVVPPNKPQHFYHWLQEFGNMGILHVLGKRQTMGTDPLFLVPPSRKALLSSANVPHTTTPSTTTPSSPNNHRTLTVAARARSKHAHRGQEQFFGIATGSPKTQNIETREILIKLLENAVWINVHTFGGMDEGKSVVEVRVESGYGARWTVDGSSPKNLEFRGFLEPQMKDGHDMGWRHGDKEYMAEQQQKEVLPSISVARDISADTPGETTLEPPPTTTTDLAKMPKLDTTTSVPVEEITSAAADVPLKPATAEEEVPEPRTVEDQTTPKDVLVEEQVAKKDKVEPLLSDEEIRKVMIEEELAKIIKETEENELKEELEPEALAALKKAAMIVAYRTKYYDVFKDEFIYFPTVTATLVSYALIEEAEKYYYDEDDDFPMYYSAALRSVAGMSAADAADDEDAPDEDYMARLAMDVDIGEDGGAPETIKDEEIQDVGEAEEEANQDDKAQKGTREWVEVGDTEKKPEEKTPAVAVSSLKVSLPEEKELSAEAPSPTVDTTEPEPTSLEEEAHMIVEAKSEHFIVVEDEEPPKEDDDGMLVVMPESLVAKEAEPVPEVATSEEPKKVEGPEEQVPEPKEDQTAPTQEEWPESSEPEPVIEEDLPEPVVVEEEPEPVVDEEEPPELVAEDEEPERVVEDEEPEPEPVLEDSDQEYVLVDEEKEIPELIDSVASV